MHDYMNPGCRKEKYNNIEEKFLIFDMHAKYGILSCHLFICDMNVEL